MRILALNSVPFVGGAERSFLDVITGLTGQGDEVFVAAPPGGALEKLVSQTGAEFVPWPLPQAVNQVGRYSGLAQYFGMLTFLPVSVWKLLQLVRKIKPDLIYSNSVKSHLLTGLISSIVKVPVIWHVRDFVERRNFAPLLFAMGRRLTAGVIVNSRAVGEEWDKRHIPVTVIYNGFKRNEPNSPSVSNSGELRLMSAGILAPWKGFECILRACASLPDLPWGLTVCGDEVYETAGHRGERARLEQLARSLNIDSRVHFTGMVKDIEPFLRNADLFLHGSIHAEPFGRVIAEAMLAGVPVLASRAGGVTEIVRDGVDGLLYMPGDTAALAAAIRELANDPERRQEMGRHAVLRIRTEFSLDQMSTAIRSMFLARIENRRRNATPDQKSPGVRAN